jgi:hypothetical protein
MHSRDAENPVCARLEASSCCGSTSVTSATWLLHEAGVVRDHNGRLPLVVVVVVGVIGVLGVVPVVVVAQSVLFGVVACRHHRFVDRVHVKGHAQSGTRLCDRGRHRQRAVETRVVQARAQEQVVGVVIANRRRRRRRSGRRGQRSGGGEMVRSLVFTGHPFERPAVARN